MSKLVTYIFSTLLFISIQAQVTPPLALGNPEEALRYIKRPADIFLFDLAEIATRKIHSAYIIRHPSGWEPNYPNPCSYGDTLDFYCFDSTGRIIQRSYFQSMGDYSTTFYYDSTGNLTARAMYRRNGYRSGTNLYPINPVDSSVRKSVIKREISGSDSIITGIIFWKFSNGFDTGYIVKKVFNPQGLLTEISSRINKRHEQDIDDDTGEFTFHYKYRYDNQDRLIYLLYYDDRYDYPSSYKIFTYTPEGLITEKRKAITDELINREFQLITTYKGVITISTKTNQITLIPLDKNSKLYKLKTVSSSDEFPYMEYFEISYQ